MTQKHTLEISGLTATAGGSEILRGVDLKVSSGEVHAIMGPNGSGKSTLSHVLMGKPGYEVTGGSVTLNGQDLLSMETWQRAKAGLFLAMQYPIEVPGVRVVDVLEASVATELSSADVTPLLAEEAAKIGLDPTLLDRPLNVDMSGGEKKRNETMQLSTLKPGIAVLDELDSGLDVDGLRVVSQRVEKATEVEGLGVLVITHYSRLLDELKPDYVHILAGGKIVDSGGFELARSVESTGYAVYTSSEAS